MATGFGLKAVRKIDGGELRVRPYVCAATEGSVIGIGEVVELDGAIDSSSQLATIKLATAGNALLGAVVGFQADPTLPYTGDYRPASTRRIALVCDDPDAIFQVQEDAVGGSVSAANIAVSANADIIVSAATSTTRVSGTMLDSSTATTSSANLKIVGVLRDDVNTAAQSGGAVLEVMIFEHALRTADSQS
jgi:hypothetical protein